MSWLQDLPIKRKLTVVILITSSAVLILACIVLAGFELFHFRRAMARDMAVLADILGKNTRAALAFQDENAARETLLALQSEPHVVRACLFDRDGKLFAAYIRLGALEQFPSEPGMDGHRFENGFLTLFRPVILNNKRIGTIYVQSDLQALSDRLRLFAGIVGMVLLGSFLVTVALSSRLQRPISKPILALAETARIIAERKDYSVRAANGGKNEIGVLTDAFNQMLAGIEERESALRTANEALQTEDQKRRRTLAQMELLNRITRAIGERQDIQSIFEVVIQNLEENLPVDFCCICLYDPMIRELHVSSVGRKNSDIAQKANLIQDVRIDLDNNGLARCLFGRLVYEPDLADVPVPFSQALVHAGLRSLVAAPLLVESQVFGILLSARIKDHDFSSSECEFLRQLSGHVALASHQTQLYSDLQKAYDDLRETQQAVTQQERLKALGQMASGIAHDINNAISPIVLYTESLLERENLSETARDQLVVIQRAVDDVAQTVSRMREFYRHRETQLLLSPVQMNHIVEQVVDLTRARWSDIPQSRGVMIDLKKDLAANLPLFMGVESEIREALTNLVFNAVDAMPDGGPLLLRTKKAEKQESSDPSQTKVEVQVEVIDHGVGMDEETRRRCLEPFYTTKGERGTGLGLPMVYGAIQRHSAGLEIESSIGKGTTIRLSFNAAIDIEALAGKKSAYAVPSSLRLLIIDDDPLLLKSLSDTLHADGHMIVTANSGQGGIDLFHETVKKGGSFSAVITDLGMPYVDGRKVSAAIKHASPTTPVFLLTGWGERLIAEDDIPLHVDCVLNKPPRLRHLRSALAEFCTQLDKKAAK